LSPSRGTASGVPEIERTSREGRPAASRHLPEPVIPGLASRTRRRCPGLGIARARRSAAAGQRDMDPPRRSTAEAARRGSSCAAMRRPGARGSPLSLNKPFVRGGVPGRSPDNEVTNFDGVRDGVTYIVRKLEDREGLHHLPIRTCAEQDRAARVRLHEGCDQQERGANSARSVRLPIHPAPLQRQEAASARGGETRVEERSTGHGASSRHAALGVHVESVESPAIVAASRRLATPTTRPSSAPRGSRPDPRRIRAR